MTELTNINNIMDISISGYQFSNWITKFKKNINNQTAIMIICLIY